MAAYFPHTNRPMVCHRQWRTPKVSEEGPKFRHNRVTSQINFKGRAEGTENRNPGQTPNTREKLALLLLKLLGFALHF